MSPISRLRWVCDSGSGAKMDPGVERAECIVGEDGRTTTSWRLWARTSTGRWAPVSEWRSTQTAICERRGGAA